jgi:hypothetical protein
VLAASVEEPAALAPWWARLLASPERALRFAYYALALLVLLALLYETRLEWRARHLRHAATAVFLLLFMLGLFTLGELLIFAHPVVSA